MFSRLEKFVTWGRGLLLPPISHELTVGASPRPTMYSKTNASSIKYHNWNLNEYF